MPKHEEDVPRTAAERKGRLDALRDRKMAATAHAFVRAKADLFYATIAEHPLALPAGPAIWISGDCHAENFGAVSDARGGGDLEMNDLDETNVGEPAHDVLRLALSLSMAARAAGRNGLDTAALLDAMVRGYDGVLKQRERGEELKLDEPSARLRKLERHAAARSRTELLDGRCPESGGKRAFPMGPRYWPLTDGERRAVKALLALPEVVALVTTLAGLEHDGALEIVDLAFRVAGTGSLGVFRVAAVVSVGGKGKKHHDDDLRLLDVKEALPTHTPRAAAVRGLGVPADDAARVVHGARALSPPIGPRLLAATLDGMPVVVRELLPQEDKVNVDGLAQDEACAVAHHLGGILGRAHARQLDPKEAKAWRAACGAKTDAGAPPSWLWSALVPLVGRHEAAYLEHCGALAVRGAAT
jgi:uncharacterized protein (DUF2252 family)